MKNFEIAIIIIKLTFKFILPCILCTNLRHLTPPQKNNDQPLVLAPTPEHPNLKKHTIIIKNLIINNQ